MILSVPKADFSSTMGIPRDIYIYRGNPVPMQENYEAARKDLEFTSSVAPGNIVCFGLGDWKHPDFPRSVEANFLSTAWFHRNLLTFADAAKLFGRQDDYNWSMEKAEKVKEAFNKKYNNGNGSFAKDEITALAVAIAFKLCPENEISATVKNLNDAVLKVNCTADFGIVGAKFVPRVLSEHGFADTALQIFTQPNYPGWAKWVIDGETTLLEDFAGKESHNHIMFGDISAWFMQYIAGIKPSFERPGFNKVVLNPCFVKALSNVSAWYDIAAGRINVNWVRDDNKITFKAEIPQGTPGELILPNGKSQTFSSNVEVSLDI